MFSLPYNLPKTTSSFGLSKFSWKKLHANKLDFSTIKITSKKVSRNTADISTREITSKKASGNIVNFLTNEITPKKVHGNNADFSNIEITSKKYVEMTKFGLHRIDIISTLNRQPFDVECPLGLNYVKVLLNRSWKIVFKTFSIHIIKFNYSC